MKKNQRIIFIAAAAFVLLGGTSIVLAFQNIQMQEQVEEIKAEKQKQKEQQILEEEMARMETYIDTLPDDYELAGYDSWQRASIIADHLYEDSDGRFKEEWGTFLALEAERKNIDPFLVYELLRVETGDTFDPETVGPETQYGHAYGMAQFMKNTGPWIADMADLPYEDDLLFDPFYSIQLSVVYLEFLYSQYEDWDYALTAYHRGIYGMEAYVEEHGDAKSWYAVEIQENAEENQQLVTLDY
ncbi:transglycosylase SLT domain-containing protein [Bacillus sp. H-16]|uniref:transglycosylase SLT domain-containing protein n=1 Tax=Alteribacter salitolerans TaxID=2912333 RepID=UPI0019646281|nr:transglycosylase SLT domain-containing protein [Alteribacter salitolerans]MBM7097076.1 transglycosylase SLT domain-containing protein [Alteribacter salitolerans]